MVRKDVLIIAVLWAAGISDGIAAGSQLPQQSIAVHLDLTEDVVSFFKLAVWVGGGFLLIYAAIGLAFFGFDVRKAKSSIDDDLKTLKALLSEANTSLASIRQSDIDLSKLKGRYEIFAERSEKRLEELGAMVEEYADNARASSQARVREPRKTFGARTTPPPEENVVKAESAAKPSDLPIESEWLDSHAAPSKLQGLAQAFNMRGHPSTRPPSIISFESSQFRTVEIPAVRRVVDSAALIALGKSRRFLVSALHFVKRDGNVPFLASLGTFWRVRAGQ